MAKRKRRKVVRKKRPAKKSGLKAGFDDSLIDVDFAFDGMVESSEDFENYGAQSFPDHLIIKRSDWDHWIDQNDKHKHFAENYSDRFTNQGNSHECVSHASCQAFLAAWNRQFAGFKYSMWPSPVALYTRCTNGRQWGGSVVQHALREMMEVGNLPEHDGPKGDNDQYKRFKYTVHQTSGRSESHWPTKGWTRKGNWDDDWRDQARHFRVSEAWTTYTKSAFVSAILRGYTVVNGRNGHSIPHMAIVKRDGRYYSKYKDSYNVFRYDSERLWGGGFCVRSVTSPDDPAKPGEMK